MHADPRCRLDQLRSNGTSSRDAYGTWTLLSHDEVVRAAQDPDRFSSAVSRFLQVPNGMDDDEHARFRALVEPYMTADRVQQLEPTCVRIADELVTELLRSRRIDAVWNLGAHFAVRSQIAWLGWSPLIEHDLVQWMHDHQAAGAADNDTLQADVSSRFDAIVRGEIARHREQPESLDDPTTELLRETIDGVPLEDRQLISILRNWTAGDLGSLAASVGVIAFALATDVMLQDRLRTLVTSSTTSDDPSTRETLDHVIDELLRIDDPFLSSRRIATCDVELEDGQVIPEGSRVVLSWAAANRDPDVFEQPDVVDPEANASHNIVYGAGPHVCPGRALATMELRVVTTALLRATTVIALPTRGTPERSDGRLGAFHRLPITID
jgi:cytochrome P450